MRQLDFHVEARIEFLEAVSRYETEVPGLGARFIAEVDRCIELVLEAPRIGEQFGRRLRRFPLNDGFPFSLVYTIRGDTIFVVAVGALVAKARLLETSRCSLTGRQVPYRGRADGTGRQNKRQGANPALAAPVALY